MSALCQKQTFTDSQPRALLRRLMPLQECACAVDGVSLQLRRGCRGGGSRSYQHGASVGIDDHQVSPLSVEHSFGFRPNNPLFQDNLDRTAVTVSNRGRQHLAQQPAERLWVGHGNLLQILDATYVIERLKDLLAQR